MDGVQITFYDFAPDLEYFGEAVLPLMKEAGLRLDRKRCGCPTSGSA